MRTGVAGEAVGNVSGDRQTVGSLSHIKSRTGSGQVDGRLDWRVRSGDGGMVRLEQGRGARCCCRAAEQRLRKEREECGVRAGNSGEEARKVWTRR